MSADERQADYEQHTHAFNPSPYAYAAQSPHAGDDNHAASAVARASASSRRAHLQLSRIDPWSVTKLGFVVSLVCFIILFVAVAVLYGVLSALGVFESISSLVNLLSNSETEDLFAMSRVLGYAAFLGAINVVLMTLLATIGAYIYNLAADLVGGIDVTLQERE